MSRGRNLAIRQCSPVVKRVAFGPALRADGIGSPGDRFDLLRHAAHLGGESFQRFGIRGAGGGDPVAVRYELGDAVGDVRLAGDLNVAVGDLVHVRERSAPSRHFRASPRRGSPAIVSRQQASAPAPGAWAIA